MPHTQSPEAIDTRLVFRVYGLTGIAAGFAVMLFGVWWLDAADRAPLGPVAMMTVAATAIWALSYYAGAFSRVDDPVSRLKALKEFVSAHMMIGVVVWTIDSQVRGVSDVPFMSWVSWVLGAILAYVAYTASPGSRSMTTLRSTGAAHGGHRAVREKEWGASVRRLRSQYEEQIRQAARQEERARLARDLHDAVKQQLFVVQTAAATVQTRFDADPAGAKAAIEQIRGAAREAIAEMAAMLDQLQAAPLENVGLVEALKKQCEALGLRTGAEVALDVATLPAPYLLPPGAQEVMFRVAQEALANVGRHARARHVTVRLAARNRSAVLEISDDGAGFDPLATRDGMGIGNMQARAADVGGQFDLASDPGTGTTITFTIPFIAESPRRYMLSAVAFGALLVLCAVALARYTTDLQRWWIFLAGAGIAAIGTARNLVAWYRVNRLETEAR